MAFFRSVPFLCVENIDRRNVSRVESSKRNAKEKQPNNSQTPFYGNISAFSRRRESKDALRDSGILSGDEKRERGEEKEGRREIFALG